MKTDVPTTFVRNQRPAFGDFADRIVSAVAEDVESNMLRVGIALTASMSQAWVYSLLGKLQQSSFANLAAVLQVPERTPVRSSVFSRRRWSRALFQRYERWDSNRQGSGKRALAGVSLAEALEGVSVVCASEATKVQELGLDVVLCFDPTVAETLPQGIARSGIWLLDIDGASGGSAQPPIWRAHTSGESCVTTRLLHFARGAGSPPQLVYETRTAVNPYSLAESRDPVYWKSVEIVLRCLRALATSGDSFLCTLAPVPMTNPPVQPLDNSLGMTRFVRREIARRLHARYPSFQRAHFAKWCIGIRAPRADVMYDSPAGYRLLVAPRDRFYADPFLFEHDGHTWLFFEDFRYPENKAVISCCELNEEGEPGAAFEVLRLPYHLSYPFLFSDGDAIYLLPESRSHRTVSLFRATAFPHAWEHDTDLFTGVDMVDATLHRGEDGTWWLFAGVSNGSFSNSDELCAYFADSFRGPWTPHPQNPVVSDVRRARPAGRIFRDGNRLIRPSQDCGPAYGYGLVFSEIETLTPLAYRERVLSRLLPESVPGNTANHTYNRTGRFETIDRFFVASRLAEADTIAFPLAPS